MKELDDNILKKFITKESSENEISEINEWIKESEENAKQLFRMEEIYELGKFDQYTDPKRIKQAEKKLFKRIEQEKESKRRKLYIRRWMNYAAIFAIVLLTGGGLSYWFYSADTAKKIIAETAFKGEVKELILPDGTKVWLNNGSTIKYAREFAKKERKVHVEGEAYFEVTKNKEKPFIVQSEVIQVKVLGTTFNFKCDKACRIAEATLLEGEIEVKGNNSEGMIILTPGQRAELNKNTKRLTVKQVNAKLDAVWRNDLIPFEQADLFTITQTLERFYNVKIILSPNIQADVTYSGVLKKQQTIESVLNSLKNAIPINYKIEGNNIFISPQLQ